MKRTSIGYNIKVYGIRSVFFKYVFSSLCIILLIFIPFYLIIYAYHNYVLTQEIAKQSTISTLQSKTIFDNITEDFHKSINMASSSDTVRRFLKAGEIDPSSHLTVQTQEFIDVLLKSSGLMDETYIYSFANDRMLTPLENNIVGDDNPYEWLRTYRSTKLPFIMFPRKENADKINYFYICSEIYEDDLPIGLFCSRMDYSKFTNIVLNSFEKRPDQIFIVSNIGLILYSDEPELINATMYERDDTYAAFHSATREGGNNIIYGDYIIAIARSTKSQLLLMSYIHKNSIKESYAFFSVLIFSGFIVIFLTSMLLSVFFSYRHYRSIAQVMDILKNPDILEQNSPLLGEFLYIAHSISDITHKNQTISNELAEKVLQLKRAQIAALQAQINPHFLFNTLQLINLGIMTEARGDTASTRLISQLSSLVREAYDTDQFIVTVEEELNITKNYLNIQKARYSSRLTVDFDIDPDCLQFKTIKLLLQPLVENSIVHGFKGKLGQWRIVVQCFTEGNFLVYQIVDNGVGIQSEQLKRLNTVLNGTNIDHNGMRVGIANVNHRLKLVYGRHCSIVVSDNTSGGTSIQIKHMNDNLI